MQLSDRDRAVLQTAEWLEGKVVNREAVILARTGLSAARFTQVLLHLVIQDAILSDPRWTALAYRIQREANVRAGMRAARTLRRPAA